MYFSELANEYLIHLYQFYVTRLEIYIQFDTLQKVNNLTNEEGIVQNRMYVSIYSYDSFCHYCTIEIDKPRIKKLIVDTNRP